MQNRRDFLKNSALLMGGSLIANDLWAGPKKPHNKPHIGVQLWSIREDMGKDAAGSLAKVAKMGYKEVEGAGYSNGMMYKMRPQDYKKVLMDNGLKQTSGHTVLKTEDYDFAAKDFKDTWKLAVETAAQVGQKWIVSPWTVDEDRASIDALKKHCEVLNLAGEHAHKLGMNFGYHNHDFEFLKLVEGQKIYDFYLKNTDKNLVGFEIDLYWVVKGGFSPEEYIKANPGRFRLCHVKDRNTQTGETVEVGEGDINFQKIFDLKHTAGLQYFIVELEHYKRPAIEGIEVSLNNLKKLKF